MNFESGGETGRPAARGAERPLAAVLSELMAELGHLVKAEVRLARSEVMEDLQRVRGGLVLVAAGGALALIAAFTLTAFVILLLSEAMAPWLAALIVTAVWAGAGAVLVMAGLRAWKRTTGPRETINTLKEDTQWASETMRTAKSRLRAHA